MRGIDIAKKYLGYEEVKNKKELMSLFKSVAIHNDIVIDPSTTPWCAAFVNSCERIAGKPGTGKLNARSFLDYGDKISIRDALEGDIIIFERGHNGWSGHVTFLVKKIADGIQVLGGNQKDSVCYSNYPLTGLLGIRRHK